MLDQNGTIACLMLTAIMTTLDIITGTLTTITKAISSTYFAELELTTTSKELLTITGLSTTSIESIYLTYFSTLS